MIVGFQKLKKASESLNQLIQVIRDPTLLSSVISAHRLFRVYLHAVKLGVSKDSTRPREKRTVFGSTLTRETQAKIAYTQNKIQPTPPFDEPQTRPFRSFRQLGVHCRTTFQFTFFHFSNQSNSAFCWAEEARRATLEQACTENGHGS